MFDTSVEQLLRNIDDTITAIESMKNLTAIQYTPQISQKDAELHEDKSANVSDLSEVSDDKSHQDTSTIDNELLEAAKYFIEKVKNEENFDSENCKKLLDSVEKQIDQIKKKSEEYSNSDIRSFKKNKNDQNLVIWEAAQYIQALSILSKDCSELSDTETESLQSICDNSKIFSQSLCKKSEEKIEEFSKFNKKLKRLIKNPNKQISEISELFKDEKKEVYNQMAKNPYYSPKGNQEKLLTLYAVYLVSTEKPTLNNDEEKIEFLAHTVLNQKKDSGRENIQNIIKPYVLKQIISSQGHILSYDEEELLRKEIKRIKETSGAQKLTSLQKELLDYEIKTRSDSEFSDDELESENLEDLKVMQRKIKKEEKRKNALESAKKKSRIMLAMLEKGTSANSDQPIAIKKKSIRKLIKKFESLKNNHDDDKISKKIPTIQEYVEVIHYLSQQEQEAKDEDSLKEKKEKKESIIQSIMLSNQETKALDEKCSDIDQKIEEEGLDKNEDWDLIDEDDKKILNFQENVNRFNSEVHLLTDKKSNEDLERHKKEEKEKKEKEERERIEKFSSKGVEENQKFIAMAKEFKDSFSPEIEVVDIVDVEGTDHDSDEDYEYSYELAKDEGEDYEHDYELTEPQVESENDETSSGKKGFFSKLKSKFKKATSRKFNSTSNTNIDDLIKEYDITTMLKEGPKNIKNAANFILSKNKKNSTLSKAMKLLLNDMNIVQNDFPYFSADYSPNLEKLKFIERIEDCVKQALYSLEEIDKSDENLKKIFILLTSFLREKEDREINLMKITDDRNKFNEKIREENYLNYEIDVREKALIKRRSKRLLKERLHDENSDDPRVKRLIKLEKEELEEEALYQKQEHEKDSRSEEATMTPEEKISERKHSIEILFRCLGVLLPKNKKAKYLTPTDQIYRDIEPNANNNFDDYRFKTAIKIKEIEADASSLNKEDKDKFLEIFNKYIKGNKDFVRLPSNCISSLEKLCKKRLTNNVTFKDLIDDDNDVLKRL